MARVRMQQWRTSAALGFLERARKVDRDSAGVPMMMGAAYAAEGRLEEVTVVLVEVVKSNPEYPNAHFKRATAYTRAENFPAAADHYRKVLEFDPDHHVARMSAAKAFAAFRKHQEVLEFVSPYTAGRPAAVDEFELRQLRGVALRGLGRYA